jgi:hypothetical protein
MPPSIRDLTDEISDCRKPRPCGGHWLWGLILAGNLSPIGASANVVILGIAKRSGQPISFCAISRSPGSTWDDRIRRLAISLGEATDGLATDQCCGRLGRRCSTRCQKPARRRSNCSPGPR